MSKLFFVLFILFAVSALNFNFFFCETLDDDNVAAEHEFNPNVITATTFREERGRRRRQRLAGK